MNRSLLTGATLAVALFSFNAHAAMHWAPAPVQHQHGGHGGHDRSAGKAFMLIEGEGAKLSLIKPTLAEARLKQEQSRVTVKPTGMGNYHALVATRSSGNLHESAIRYHYMHGKPPGTSPSLVIGHEKSALEIKPAPLAREHWRHYSGTDAAFMVIFEGKPLADAVVTMATANGSSSEFVSDAEGKLLVPLPEDFTAVKAGRQHNRASEFLLSVRHESGEQICITTYSSAYHVNPRHWQSTELGLAVVGGGMLLGGLMTFRKRRRKEK